MSVPDPTPKHLAVLRKYFGHSQFRPMQWKIIYSILEKKQDNCVVMATGYGKSLCYQYPAVYSNGLSIVVSPLISLMQDQVLSLQMSNIEACYLGSAASSKYKSEESVLNGTCKLLYVTPEWCATEAGLQFLKQISVTVNLTLIAIDEAHCVSQWGFDFRQSYRQLGLFRRILPNTPILAVTATATPQVRLDICASLKLLNASITCSSFDRPNLYLAVSLKTKDIFADMQKLLITHGFNYKFPGPTIIYCPTKSQTEKVADELNANGIKCAVYHADLSLKIRQTVHEHFIKDIIQVVVATVAFGMGIDKPDVRCVIHYGAPKEIESYYQEVGRAGRDGLPSTCHVFFATSDFNLQKYFLSTINSSGAKYKEHKELMARRMQQYLETRECRRRLLLEHFNDITAKEPKQLKPNCCDNCSKMLNSGKDPQNVPEIQITEEVQQLLRVFDLFSGRFGLVAPIKFLRGTAESRIPQANQSNPLYATGKETSEAAWKALGKLCLREGLLEEKSCSTFPGRKLNKFPMSTVFITSLGKQFIQKGEATGIKLMPTAEVEMLFQRKMKLPIETEKKVYFEQFKSKKQTEKEKEQQAALFQLLKNLRIELATNYKCAPHMVVPDKTLYDVAVQKPTTLKDLSNIDGFHESRLEKFGSQILEAINEYCNKQSEPVQRTSAIECDADDTLDDMLCDKFFNNAMDYNKMDTCYEEYKVKETDLAEYDNQNRNDSIAEMETEKPVPQMATESSSAANDHSDPTPEKAKLDLDDLWGNISDELFDSFPLDEVATSSTVSANPYSSKTSSNGAAPPPSSLGGQQMEQMCSWDSRKTLPIPEEWKEDDSKLKSVVERSQSVTGTAAHQKIEGSSEEGAKKRVWLAPSSAKVEMKKRMKKNTLFKL